jgi:putative SOS response-associated peptidase YedK
MLGRRVHQPCLKVGAIHPKAMPAMLDRNSFNRWLDDDHLSACELAVPYADEKVVMLA